MARCSGAFPIGRQHRAQATVSASPRRSQDRTRLRARFFWNRAENRPASPPSRGGIDGVPETTAYRSCVRYQYRYIEIIAARMLSRKGIAAIWQLHLTAAAAFRRGNWLSATALVGIADAAERLWRRGDRG